MITCLHVCINYEDMVLFWVKQKLDFRLPLLLRKPLYDCLTCMGGIYGIAAWFLVFNYSVDWKIIPFILSVAGLNAIIQALFELIKHIILAAAPNEISKE